jgi:hypothetical protein
MLMLAPSAGSPSVPSCSCCCVHGLGPYLNQPNLKPNLVAPLVPCTHTLTRVPHHSFSPTCSTTHSPSLLPTPLSLSPLRPHSSCTKSDTEPGADISVEQGKVSVSCKQEARGGGRQACARLCGCKGDKLVRLQEKQKCTCIAEVVMATEPAASNVPRSQGPKRALAAFVDCAPSACRDWPSRTINHRPCHQTCDQQHPSVRVQERARGH